jgi:predicted TIM-barrel fold metal-dependent hydrolase
MRVIALEEHYRSRTVIAAIGNRAEAFGPLREAFGDKFSKLEDLGAGRIAEMDAAGIDVQVLSHSPPSPDSLEAPRAISLAQQANDEVARAVERYPTRLAAFATLPLADPPVAARELERTAEQLHFKGAMINGTPQGRFLDDPFFNPVLERAEALGVPLYLHPAPPAKAVRDAYYVGLDGALAGMLSTAGWGWHAEQGLHVLRMIATGVFDRFPRLQIIIGHMGEMIPFYLARSDAMLTPVAKGLRRSVADYVRDNVHITTSGMFTVPPLRLALEVLGADRIMFSVDYPFSSNQHGREFLRKLSFLPPADFERITHGNAERLLGLTS